MKDGEEVQEERTAFGKDWEEWGSAWQGQEVTGVGGVCCGEDPDGRARWV